jgi:pimeloyl-ACP methyl ester carboxylesterase
MEWQSMLFTPPNGQSFAGYIGHSWESAFEAKPECLPWDNIPSYYIGPEKDPLIPVAWQKACIKPFPSMKWIPLPGASHSPFHSHWAQLEDFLVSPYGIIQSIREQHENTVYRRSQPIVSRTPPVTFGGVM